MPISPRKHPTMPPPPANGDQDKLGLQQARVLRALVPNDPNDPPFDWPLFTRAALCRCAGFKSTSGSITRVLNGIRPGNRTSGAPHPGLVERGLVEIVKLDMDGLIEVNYRATQAGVAAYQAFLAAGGVIPVVKDSALCTNDRYQQPEPIGSQSPPPARDANDNPQPRCAMPVSKRPSPSVGGSQQSMIGANTAALPSASPSPERNTNGQGNGSLASAIVRHLEENRPDEVEIGKVGYVQAPVDDSASWADLAEANNKVKYLLRDWIPYDMLSAIVGDSKVGKSMFLQWGVVRPIIIGCEWFTGQQGAEPGYVVWCDTERRAAINLDRAIRWGLPLDRIITPFSDKHKMFDMQDAEHIKRLTDVVCRYQARAVILDSFRGAHRGDENNSKMDAALKDLGSVCEQTHSAILIIHHTKKTRIEGEEAGGEPTLHCARGSSAFLAAVACQIVIDIPDPRPNLKEAWRRVQVLGDNLGIAPKPVGFRIHDGGLEFGPAPRREETEKKGSERDKCKKWLDSRMPHGSRVDANLIIAEAESLGWSKTGTLQRAKTELGIVSDQSVKPHQWVRDIGALHGGYQETAPDSR